MSTVLVGIPVIKDARKFHLDKGRRWTVIEHILLEALAKQDWSISALEEESGLPRRVVIEVVIRLMRTGWVELRTGASGILFAATAHGRLYAAQEDLPPVTRPASKYVGYVVDLFSGAVFRARELVTIKQEQWGTRSAGRSAQLLPELLEPNRALPDVQVLADKLLESDEHLTRVALRDWRPQKRIGVVTVRDGEIEGLGGQIPDLLKSAILAAADGATRNAAPVYPLSREHPPALHMRSRETRRISFRQDDLVLGGAAHEQMLRAVLARAQHRIVIHSTFMEPSRAEAVLELMRPAIQKGALVDILWGQAKEKNNVNATREAANQLRSALVQQGLQDRVRVHPSSTRSHAKLILADTGEVDRFQALIGSCNWLSSDFGSFDVSVRLRDAAIIGDLAYDLAELARPQDKQIPLLSTELLRLGRSLIATAKAPSGRSTAKLITGPEHAQILQEARDKAKRDILVLSHRLDVAAKPNLATLAAAAPGTQRRAFYGRLGDNIPEAAACALRDDTKGKGIRLEMSKAKLHGKVLAWDDDNLLVTSLNLLSADPPDYEPRQEIGILLNAPDAALLISTAFGQANQTQTTKDAPNV